MSRIPPFNRDLRGCVIQLRNLYKFRVGLNYERIVCSTKDGYYVRYWAKGYKHAAFTDSPIRIGPTTVRAVYETPRRQRDLRGCRVKLNNGEIIDVPYNNCIRMREGEYFFPNRVTLSLLDVDMPSLDIAVQKVLRYAKPPV